MKYQDLFDVATEIIRRGMYSYRPSAHDTLRFMIHGKRDANWAFVISDVVAGLLLDDVAPSYSHAIVVHKYMPENTYFTSEMLSRHGILL